MTEEMSKSRLKKVNRKVVRLEANLTKKCGLHFSPTPTTSLLLGNAGLRNDVTRDLLERALVQQFSPPLDYVELSMPTEATFAILLFDNLQSAQRAHGDLCGFSLATPDLPARLSVTLYPLYIAERERGDALSRLLGGVSLAESSEGPSPPPGITLTADFVTTAEAALLEIELEVNLPPSSSLLKQRRVLHFGYEFLYGRNTVDPSKPLVDRPLPPTSLTLIDRLESAGLISQRPDQLTVNVYEPGQGIPPHVDTHSAFEEELVSVSLGSATVMQFATGCEVRDLPLPPNSVLVMRGEARYLWTHSIPARKWDLVRDPQGRWSKQLRGRRVSLTLRCLRRPQICRCFWPEKCDTALAEKNTETADGHNNSSIASDLAADPITLEKCHVHQVYDEIADHFSATRHSMWPSVERFIASLEPGSLLVDVGCGNGKYLGLAKSRLLPVLACDRSFNLSRICRDLGHDAVQADILSLPYRSDLADSVICIAVIHHLSTQERRHAAIVELARILRPGGLLLIHVWAMEQEDVSADRESRTMTNGDEAIAGLPVHVNRTRFREPDMLVPWHLNKNKSGDQVFHRYYHLYSEGELQDACKATGLFSEEPVASYYDKGNWSVVVRKL